MICTGAAGAEGPASEIVFGLMNFSHRTQQHRYIITYDMQLEQFSVGSWTGWRRIQVNGEDQSDLDAEGAEVQMAASETVSTMDAQWLGSPVACTSLDQLHTARMRLELVCPDSFAPSNPLIHLPNI